MNNLGNTEIESKFEKAVQLLCRFMPVGEERKKPLLMHALRVGMYLYERNYSANVVLGGLLHDVLEWTESPDDLVRTEFGDEVYAIVKATKDRNISDPVERRREYIDRCAMVGKDALVVKAADTLDSYRFYTSASNPEEVSRSVDIAKTILEKLPADMNDHLFDELKRIQ